MKNKFSFIITVFFEIFLVLSLSFIVSLNSKIVYAQSFSSEEKVCCPKAVVDGETKYCQYTDPSNCDGGSGIPTTCEDTAICKPVCCDLNEFSYDFSSGLGCYANVPADTCLNSFGGKVVEDSSCNSASQCQRGCCLLGTQGTLTTESGCRDLTSRYPDLEMNYRVDVNTELDCLNLARAEKKGCCVSSSDQGESCGLTTFANCQGEFYENTDCINVENKCEQCKYGKSISKKEWSTSCAYEYGDNVYYKDKCGNPIVFDQTADECSYTSGFLCKEENENKASCADLNCKAEVLWDNPRVDEDGSCSKISPAIGEISFDNSCWTDDTGDQDDSRVNGESWCEFDADAGPGRDLPGTRHYKHYCYEGEEKVEECRGLREEFCMQFDGLSQSVAKCIPNRAIEQPCGACTDRTCCENADLRDCIWIAANQEQTNQEVQEINEDRRRQSEERETNYTETATPTVDEEGVCIPLVPPGITNDDPSLCAYDTGQGNVNTQKFKSYWHTPGWGYDWDCDGGCEIYTQKFAYQQNDLCKTYGDCGANYNLAGVWSSAGFERKPCNIDIDGEAGDLDVEEYKTFVSDGNYGDDEADNMLDNCLEQLPDPADKTDEEINFEKYIQYKNLLDFDVGASGGSTTFDEVYGLSLFIGTSAVITTATILAIAGVESTVAGILLTSAAVTPVGAVVWAVVLGTVLIVSFATSGTSEDIVEVTCNPWQPPAGSENCNLCHEAGEIKYKLGSGGLSDPVNVDFTANGLHSCTEYLCQSLGEGCEFVSDTNEGPKCLSSCDTKDNGRRDINFNVYQISPLKLKHENKLKCTIGSDYSSQEKDCSPQENANKNGYDLNFIKANTNVVVGIKTDELATCKWDFARPENTGSEIDAYNSLGKSFDQISASMNHTVTLETGIDISTEDKKTMYVACLDVCENTNYPSFYTINLEVGNVQDVGAPMMLDLKPASGSAVANNAENKIINLRLNEPAYCRWSKTNDFYDAMLHEANCRTANTFNGCNIELIELEIGANTFFIRCSDADGNKNLDSIPSNEGYTLFRSEPLQISSVACEDGLNNNCGEIYSKNFTLVANTAGGGFGGKSICSIKETGDLPYEFRFTNSSLHKQIIGPKRGGNYTAEIKCIDDVGNQDLEIISYNLIVDESAPQILKLNWQNENLNILTDEDSNCRYALNNTVVYADMNDFASTGGKVHSLAVNSDYVYVKCKDRFEHVSGIDVYKT